MVHWCCWGMPRESDCNMVVCCWKKNIEKEQHKGMMTMIVSARIWAGFHPYHVTLLTSGLAVLPPLFLLAPFVESQEFWLQELSCCELLCGTGKYSLKCLLVLTCSTHCEITAIFFVSAGGWAVSPMWGKWLIQTATLSEELILAWLFLRGLIIEWLMGMIWKISGRRTKWGNTRDPSLRSLKAGRENFVDGNISLVFTRL